MEVIIMMEGCSPEMMMDMMPKMMEGCSPEMMMDMMPKCIGMMIDKIPEEKRTELVKKMVSVLIEQGGAGMTEEDKKDLAQKIMGKAKV
jgi:hypothetical protein